MIASLIAAAAFQPATAVGAVPAAKPNSCEAYLGSKPSFTDFLSVVDKLKGVTRGKYEKSIDYEARLDAARKSLPAKAIFKVERGNISFKYDADTQKLDYDMQAYGKGETYDWSQASEGYEAGGGTISWSLNDGMSFRLKSVSSRPSSYVATNAFGAIRRVQKRETTAWLLQDTSLYPEGSATFSGEFTALEARKFARWQAALLVDLQARIFRRGCAKFALVQT